MMAAAADSAFFPVSTFAGSMTGTEALEAEVAGCDEADFGRVAQLSEFWTVLQSMVAVGLLTRPS